MASAWQRLRIQDAFFPAWLRCHPCVGSRLITCEARVSLSHTSAIPRSKQSRRLGWMFSPDQVCLFAQGFSLCRNIVPSSSVRPQHQLLRNMNAVRLGVDLPSSLVTEKITAESYNNYAGLIFSWHFGVFWSWLTLNMSRFG